MTTRYEKRKNLSQTEIVLAVIKSKTTITCPITQLTFAVYVANILLISNS